ncbi:hypothetical protein IG631_18803 [Alternaria alternata]|nr:hypothetical protein IG631_18803 [Alternaria alternata]
MSDSSRPVIGAGSGQMRAPVLAPRDGRADHRPINFLVPDTSHLMSFSLLLAFGPAS